jgi:hypothetical protein
MTQPEWNDDHAALIGDCQHLWQIVMFRGLYEADPIRAEGLAADILAKRQAYRTYVGSPLLEMDSTSYTQALLNGDAPT